jgi:hypothetical protein
MKKVFFCLMMMLGSSSFVYSQPVVRQLPLDIRDAVFEAAKIGTLSAYLKTYTFSEAENIMKICFFWSDQYPRNFYDLQNRVRQDHGYSVFLREDNCKVLRKYVQKDYAEEILDAIGMVVSSPYDENRVIYTGLSENDVL